MHKKENARKPVTEREQFNTATLLFRKIAETISMLTEAKFSEKIRLFVDIHTLIRADQPIELLLDENAMKTLSLTDGSAIKNPTQETSSPVSENSEFDNDVKTPDRKTITKNPHECSSPVSEENEPDPTEKVIYTSTS